MVLFQNIIELSKTFMIDTSSIFSFLSSEIWGGFTPLMFLSFTGLTTYLMVAIVKWVLQ